MEAASHTQPAKFGTLFTDPRHYRGDCRLVRTAVRRGWLDGAPQADRDALVERFARAIGERDAAGFKSDSQRVRAILAQVKVAFDMVAVDQRDERREWCETIAGVCEWNGGRPRERWHIDDYLMRLDANQLRRRAQAEGIDLRTLQGVSVHCSDNLPPARARVVHVCLAMVPDARYGWRLWLVCPGCQSQRLHLYPMRNAFRCRVCANIRYVPNAHI